MTYNHELESRRKLEIVNQSNDMWKKCKKGKNDFHLVLQKLPTLLTEI